MFHYPEIDRNQVPDVNGRRHAYRFVEVVCNEKVIYNDMLATAFHTRCRQVAERAQLFAHNPRGKIFFVEKHLADNVKYDDAALQRQDYTHRENGEQRGKAFGTNTPHTNGTAF